ncbi:MAG: zinc-dependent metalloprotease, partial [Pseudobdellovibrionaceae bacterium]
MYKLKVNIKIIFVSILIFLFGCSKQHSTDNIHSSRLADSNIQSSFSLFANSEKSLTESDVKTRNDHGFTFSGNKVSIKKSALEKAFLLSPTMIVSTSAPIIDHLAPKVVSFERSGSNLAMMELDTNAVYQNFRSSRLLEVFEIEGETEDEVSFKWNLTFSAIPMTTLFSSGTSDMPESASGVNHLTPILPVQKSFVRKAFIANNQLHIEQVSEVQISKLPLDLIGILIGGGVIESKNSATIKLNVSIKPYQLNNSYHKRLSPFNKGIGTFEVSVTRPENGTSDRLSTLWDLSPEKEPLTYAITKSAPPEYIESIKEGILYWNKVAGREIVKVTTGADPESFPSERVVLVHWIPYDKAGFARASLQADPITGELLRADVYLTSSFAKGGANNLRKYLEFNKEPNHTYGLLPSSFNSSTVCNYDANTAENIKLINLAQENPEQIKRVANDVIRNVTAHEVGHTLGMRHNFAGSMTTEFNKYSD